MCVAAGSSQESWCQFSGKKLGVYTKVGRTMAVREVSLQLVFDPNCDTFKIGPLPTEVAENIARRLGFQALQTYPHRVLSGVSSWGLTPLCFARDPAWCEESWLQVLSIASTGSRTGFATISFQEYMRKYH